MIILRHSSIDCDYFRSGGSGGGSTARRVRGVSAIQNEQLNIYKNNNRGQKKQNRNETETSGRKMASEPYDAPCMCSDVIVTQPVSRLFQNTTSLLDGEKDVDDRLGKTCRWPLTSTRFRICIKKWILIIII